MKTRVIFVLSMLMCWGGLTFAQQVDAPANRNCHTMEADAALRARNPELGSLDEFEQWLAPLVEQYKADMENGNQRVGAVTTIPVIFHVIHNGEAVGTGTNVATTYINSQLTQLNNDFRRISGTSGFNNNPVGADSEIEFCLATQSPTGATLATPGVNRINRNSVGFSAPPYGVCCGPSCFDDTYIENTIKPTTQWNPDQYLNIWVMEINCSILGYAQFPSNSGLSGLNTNGGAASTDGVVLNYFTLGSTTNPHPVGGTVGQGRTATHEVGHWVGLRHIWGDGGCGVDDFCADTPESDAPNFGCPTGHVSCSSTDMIQNYMDYTDDPCMNIFTQNQKARMQTVLANSPRRGVLANSPACGGTPPPTGCGSTVSTFPYGESFESGWGAWTQVTSDDFDWSRLSGATPSSNTGPTAASAGSFYIYVEASSPNYASKNTIIEGPCFDLAGKSTATFSFDYHIYGSTTAGAVGTLALQVSTNNGTTWTTIWSRTGNQGNAWQVGSVNLDSYTGGTIQLRFNATTGNSWQGDMAVDDLGMTAGGGQQAGCTTTITSFPYSESFESSFGSWSQATGDDFDWSRLSGGTPSSNTGPASASAGSWYVYTESSSPNFSTKVAILNGPCFDLSGASSPEFTFDYHLYGATTMGSLQLQVSTNGTSWTTLWSRTGNQGNAWQEAVVDLSAYAGTSVQLRFRGTTGTTWQGDMAIDNVGLVTAPACNTVNITITFDNYPEETAWEIRQGASVVASGGTYGSQADGSTLVISECIPDGCYDFVITDVYGDGICCAYGNGSYLVTNNGQTLASGGSFGSSETTAFCVSGGNRDAGSEPAAAMEADLGNFTIYPNPTRSVLNVAFDAGTDGEATVMVTDLAGRVLSEQAILVNQGMNDHRLQLKEVPSGTYMLVLRHDGGQLTKRFTVMD